MIDFTMTGFNMKLLVGLALFLEGICILLLMHPIKKRKHFTIRDYILLIFAVLVAAGGLITFIFGLCSAVPQMLG